MKKDFKTQYKFLSNSIKEEINRLKSKIDGGFSSQSKHKGKLLVSVKNMWKIYGSTPVVKNFNLDIYEGESIALMGANGAGKTTVVETICGINNLTKGNIVYNFGVTNFKQKIGIQFQDNFYPPGITTKLLVDFYRDVYEKYQGGIDIDQLIKDFDIKRLYKRSINKLSGGELQRLNILLAIINNPTLVFFDELSTGLDIQAKLRIVELIKTLKEKHNWTVVIITHNIEDITALCDRVVVMSNGQKVFDDTVEHIFKRYNSLESFISKEVRSTLIETQKEVIMPPKGLKRLLSVFRKGGANVTSN